MSTRKTSSSKSNDTLSHWIQTVFMYVCIKDIIYLMCNIDTILSNQNIQNIIEFVDTNNIYLKNVQ